MICCKCHKEISKTYGSVTDLGNYCKECAKQNKVETAKLFETNMKSVLEIEKRNAVIEFAKKCKERINADYVNGGLNNHKGHLTEYDIDELIKEFTE